MDFIALVLLIVFLSFVFGTWAKQPEPKKGEKKQEHTFPTGAISMLILKLLGLR